MRHLPDIDCIAAAAPSANARGDCLKIAGTGMAAVGVLPLQFGVRGMHLGATGAR